MRQAPLTAPVGVHDVSFETPVAVADESDPPPVRGPGRTDVLVGRRFWPRFKRVYLSAYFVGGRGRKPAITENMLADDLPRLVVFVSRDLTARTGCAMRNLRNARRLWASRAGLIDAPLLTLDAWLAAALLSARSP